MSHVTRTRNEYFVFTSVPAGPVLKRIGKCPDGPGNCLYTWWTQHGGQVRSYILESQLFLPTLVPQLTIVRRDIDNNDPLGWAMFHTITFIRNFEIRNQAITQVLAISLDKPESNVVANTSKDLAERCHNLIGRVRNQLSIVADEIYVSLLNNVEARARCSLLVRDLITEINQLLANNNPAR